ncbi:MAG: DUF3050 domain-containing protein [Chitinophagaceae bacterium]
MQLFIDHLDVNHHPLADEIRTLTRALYDHKLYKSVKTIGHVRTYMAHQVWCVWDFMALLKGLQNEWLSHSIEWLPPQDGSIGAYLYEILLTEETDITHTGSGHCSHFETYIKAMKEAKADVEPITVFIEKLKAGKNFAQAISNIDIPPASLTFITNTMKHAKSKVHKLVAVFCLSREGIIPGMFTTFLENFSLHNNLAAFRWYLKRHIEVDSDTHGPLSAKLFKSVMHQDPTLISEALSASIDALQARKVFLDAIYEQILLIN